MRGVFLGILIAAVICAPGVWLVAQGHIVIGFAVMLAPGVVGILSMWRDEREVKRQAVERGARQREAASAPLRAELEQTPEWWDREYQALVKSRIPRDWAYHQDHDLDEPITFYASSYEISRHCLDCGVSIERPPDG